jgi:hypothetical protein
MQAVIQANDDLPTTYVQGTDGHSWIASFNRRVTDNLNLYTQLLLNCSQLETLSFVIHRHNGLHHHGWCVCSFQASDIHQCWIRCQREWATTRARQASLRRLNRITSIRRQNTGWKPGHGSFPLTCSRHFSHSPSTTPTPPPSPPFAQKLQISGQVSMGMETVCKSHKTDKSLTMNQIRLPFLNLCL